MKTIILLLTISICQICLGQSDQWHLIQGPKQIDGITTNCDNLWLNTEDGLINYNTITKEKIVYNSINSSFVGYTSQIAIDAQGNKWLASTSGLFKLNENGFSAIELTCLDTNYNTLNLSNIKVDLNNDIWVTGTYNGIYKYSQATQTCESILLENNTKFYHLTKDENGIIYFLNYTTIGGMRVYKYDGIVSLIAELDSVNFENKTINSFLVDQSGIIWITFDVGLQYGKDDYTVLNGGLLIFDNGSWNEMTSLEINGIDACGFINIFKDNSDNIYVQQNWGFMSFTGIIKTLCLSYNHETKLPELIETPFEDITNKLMLVDADNLLYFNDLNSVITKNGVEETISTSNLPDIQESFITSDSKNNLWLASRNGIHKLLNGNITTYNNLPISLEDYFIQQIYAGVNDHIWINFSDFFLEYDLINWNYRSKSLFGIEDPSENFLSYQNDKLGNAWILTKNNLLKSDGLNWQIITIPKEEGEYIDAMAVDDSIIFISSTKSLMLFDGANWNIYNENNSILPAYRSTDVMSLNNDGTLFFGGYDGLYKLEDNIITFLSNFHVKTILFNEESNTIWVVDNYGIKKLIESDNFITYSLPQSLHNNFFRGTIDSNQNIILLGDMPNADLQIFNESGLIGYDNFVSYTENMPPSSCRESKNENSTLLVSPNPSANTISLHYNLPENLDILVEIYTLDGRSIKNVDLYENREGNQITTINISTLAIGIYFVRLSGKGINISTKFVKI